MTALSLLALASLLAAQDAPPREPADLTVAPQTEFRTPQERLDERLDALAQADTMRVAAPLIDEIHALWAHSGSDTVSLLMDRGRAAEAADNEEIAARMYDHVTRLDPDFAEGWLAAGRMATQFEDWGYALETLNTALTLEPRRYDAYVTLGRVLERAERYDAALEAYEAALAIFPAHEAAQEARDRINAALAGRAL
ncbi:tetratricopeptide repeat protein [Maricaulis parjimensis]|uniref:tetratricopeptide repeat protein n=1 Tax=Maricaulis parjimensis TaxID=144023 RepID=UPI00193A4255|nr:tetratricopeptide repeat protein [Maricaulis parjimensis]